MPELYLLKHKLLIFQVLAQEHMVPFQICAVIFGYHSTYARPHATIPELCCYFWLPLYLCKTTYYHSRSLLLFLAAILLILDQAISLILSFLLSLGRHPLQGYNCSIIIPSEANAASYIWRLLAYGLLSAYTYLRE